MRDLIAGLVAVGLLIVAASLATTLRLYRRGRKNARDAQRTLGRSIVAEIPTSDDLALFTEDERRFYYGDRVIDKNVITAVRVLINGAPIAEALSRRAATRRPVQRVSFDDRPEGIARDRWDVAIETAGPPAGENASSAVILVECGAIRERVSQELARAVFEAIRQEIERRDRQA